MSPKQTVSLNVVAVEKQNSNGDVKSKQGPGLLRSYRESTLIFVLLEYNYIYTIHIPRLLLKSSDRNSIASKISG